MTIHKFRILIFSFFGLAAIASAYLVFQIRFSYEIEQFFPTGDEDLEFYQEFIQDFEADDNFLLIAIENERGVFEKEFLKDFHRFSLDCEDLPYVQQSQSITKISYPEWNGFRFSGKPVIQIEDEDSYADSKEMLLGDPRFAYTFIAPNTKSMVVLLKTADKMKLEQSRALLSAVKALLAKHSFNDYHLLGRAYFQAELSELQKWEVFYSTLVSILLVAFIMMIIFRKAIPILVAMGSIALGFLLFLGLMGLLGREFNAMSAVYPVLMLIVGTSDVVHIMTKYIDEIKNNVPKLKAIEKTIREIGLATLLTSVTTAIGFGALMSSRIGPVQAFGLNAAIGVLLAYFTVIFFTTALLSLCHKDQLIRSEEKQRKWEYLLVKLYRYTKKGEKQIYFGSLLCLILCFIGISMVSTNFKIRGNLPLGAKITEDFEFFEKNYAGFRSLEYAVLPQQGYMADDLEVLKEIDAFENELIQSEEINSVQSINTIYKSVNMALLGNQLSEYRLPQNDSIFNRIKIISALVPTQMQNVLLTKDKKKARITAKIYDIGADNSKEITSALDDWIRINSDSSIVKFQRTGTGLIIDKNAEYIRNSLVEGLGLALVFVCLLMGLLFRSVKMVFISLVPNLIPLLVTAAILGYFNIALESGLSIVFAIVFGIAVDDTIHFLSRFKISFAETNHVEKALAISFKETGKAIILTSIILFFGFLVLLFSANPASVTVGLLISFTLLSAVIADLTLLPVLIRAFFKPSKA